LNPVAGSSLYFVAKGDGSHVFSDDLDAHNSAVRDYQLKRRADYRSSPAPAAAPAPTVAPAADSPASPPEPVTVPDAPQSEPDTQ
ncbi:aminodeoxychorismate lyase, partial [Pseudomonas syringae pv. actinidiae]|nr:aminodeoxychorismate lyase [Pseudomonas syringae pv. actinidiae]